MSTVLKLKRSSQSGNAPDTDNIVEGELALNTADKILYSRGGSTIFQIGANITESFTVNPGTAADTITLGATAQTGTITLGQSTKDNTINIGNAATESDQEQIINIGSGTGSGTSTVNIAAKSSQGNDTAVTIGGNDPNTGTTTVAIRGATTFTSGDTNFNGDDFNVEPAGANRTITIGKTTQNATGIITLGQSTATNTINIGNAATANEATQTINIGGGNASGGDTVLNLAANTLTAANTAVTIGSSNSTGTMTVAIRGASTFTNGAVAFNGGNFTVNPNFNSSTITIGKTTGTGIITLGQSIASQTISIGSGANPSLTAQTINIGNALGVGGSKTVNICASGIGSGTKVVNINTNSSTSGLSGTTTIGSLHTAALSNNYLYGITRIKKTNGQPLIVESTSTSTNTTQQGLQLYNTSTASALKFGNYSSLAQVQSYFGSGSGASIQFIYGQNGEKHRLDASGKFGIGVSSPLEALHVNGNIIATGNVTAYYSDERLKDFKGAIPDALDKVNKLTGYYYKPNALAHSLGVDNTELEVGVSAQEVEEVLPEIVTKSAVGQDEFGEDYKSVSYDKLTPLLIEAVKELTQKVAYLESKISEKGE
jgi:hypothetical protein